MSASTRAPVSPPAVRAGNPASAARSASRLGSRAGYTRSAPPGECRCRGMTRRRIGHWRASKDASEAVSTAPSDPSYWDGPSRQGDDDDFDDGIDHLYEDDGAALARWKDRLGE